ncbi:hypothetical protein [Shouchella lehensis]|uniref:ABC transporter substrate-binding protein n=1 Tax=Shouchella lehensis TaxID=300825 RepID=A0A4Y7WLJ0_9BACI|nr:hypothetical protein [Shouchella lehensis]MBG9783099.1 hypothetical protein [Shouchella lehensis]TES49539.1 hypothetical protein E2L03_08715 [Shouchella lehensis]
MGGNTEVISTHLSDASQYIRSGDMKVWGISATERINGEFSKLPTYKEQRVDVEYNLYRGIFGPKDMDEELVSYWDNLN